MDYKRRQKALQALLERSHLDALLVTHRPNVCYLCGFTGTSGALLIGEAGCTFFTDGRYTEQAREQVKGAHVVIGRDAPLVSAGKWIRARGRAYTYLGIESEHLSVAEKSRLRSVTGSGIKLRGAPALVERLRMIKDDEEIERLRNAAKHGTKLFDVALRNIRPGVLESDVAAEMEYAARRRGAEGMSFETIIASGPRSALPHGRASTSPIPGRGFVVCDFGVILTGYCSDMTRTVHVGKLRADARRMYEAVREAQQTAVDAVQAGVSAGSVDHVARKLLIKSGFGHYFTHSTGHGVGLEIHEAPRIARGQDEILRAGMVITIEPGAYIPETGGVRIEDTVLVTESGCEVLTPTSKELITI